MGPCTATGKYTADDYKLVVANMHEAGEIARQVRYYTDGGVYPGIHVNRNFANVASADPRSSAPECPAHARLLPLLVRPQ